MLQLSSYNLVTHEVWEWRGRLFWEQYLDPVLPTRPTPTPPHTNPAQVFPLKRTQKNVAGITYN